MYSHKLLQLLPLHAGGKLALLICVEAITMPFVSLGSPSEVWLAICSIDAGSGKTYPSIMCEVSRKQAELRRELVVDRMDVWCKITTRSARRGAPKLLSAQLRLSADRDIYHVTVVGDYVTDHLPRSRDQLSALSRGIPTIIRSRIELERYSTLNRGVAHLSEPRDINELKLIVSQVFNIAFCVYLELYKLGRELKTRYSECNCPQFLGSQSYQTPPDLVPYDAWSEASHSVWGIRRW